MYLKFFTYTHVFIYCCSVDVLALLELLLAFLELLLALLSDELSSTDRSLADRRTSVSGRNACLAGAKFTNFDTLKRMALFTSQHHLAHDGIWTKQL
jgi:hypothetical protein